MRFFINYDNNVKMASANSYKELETICAKKCDYKTNQIVLVYCVEGIEITLSDEDDY